MPHTLSPLRYPGGKTVLSDYLIKIYAANNLFEGDYIEPYAGGAGVAWKLLLNDYVWSVHLNDLDRSVYSFWHCVLNETESLCKLIEETKINMDQWYIQKEIQTTLKPNLLKLGFSTLYLNRTNRSGILNAGVIGGKKQKGKWKLNARFNKDVLIEKILRIAKYKARIKIYNQDAAQFLNKQVTKLNKKALVYLDPPYYSKGQLLYQNHYKHDDHVQIAEMVKNIKQKWIVTYDKSYVISKLYSNYRKKTYCLNYTAHLRRKGAEIMIFDNHLLIPKQRSILSM